MLDKLMTALLILVVVVFVVTVTSPRPAESAEPKFYPLMHVCVVPVAPGKCHLFLDEQGPYIDMAACKARLDEMVMHSKVKVFPLLGSTIRFQAICDTLDKLRKIWPGAYPEAGTDT